MQKKKENEKNQNLVWRKISLGLVSLLIIFGLGTIVSSYLDTPIVSQGFADWVDASIGSLPLIPKTNSQILKAAFAKNSTIDSTSEKAQVRLLSQNNEKMLEINSAGYFDKNKEKTHETNLKASFGTRNEFSLANIESLEKGDNLYFKINSFDTGLGMNLDNIFGKWYRINIKNLQDKINAQARSDEEIKSDIKNYFQKGLESSKLKFKDFSRSEENFENKKVFKFSRNLTPNEFNGLFSQNFKLKEAKVNLFVDKETGYLVGGRLETSFPDSELDKLSLTTIFKEIGQSIHAEISFSLGNINKTQAKLISQEAVQKEPLGLLAEIQGASKEIDPSTILSLVDKTTEFSANILTLERLQHVFLLFPTAF